LLAAQCIIDFTPFLEVRHRLQRRRRSRNNCLVLLKAVHLIPLSGRVSTAIIGTGKGKEVKKVVLMMTPM
jgi:hypothetical protein